jgi:hypothetical protein
LAKNKNSIKTSLSEIIEKTEKSELAVLWIEA